MSEPTRPGGHPPSLIVDVAARALFHPILLVSLFVTFRGHNAPGGGFAGGLIVAAAFALRFLAGGPAEVRRATRIPPLSLVGAGLGLAVFTAIVPLFVGDTLLESAIIELDLPAIGKLKVVTAAFFDLGVYLLVIGVVITVFTMLGEGAGSDDADDDTFDPEREPGEVAGR